MPISFACSCGKKYSAPDNAAGKTVKCKACGAGVKVPGGAKPATAAIKAPAKAAAVPPPPPSKQEDSYDFADPEPAKAAPGEVFQGLTPDQLPEGHEAKSGAAAALFGQDTGKAARGAAAKQKEAKGGLMMWAIIGGIILVVFLVLKFAVIK